MDILILLVYGTALWIDNLPTNTFNFSFFSGSGSAPLELQLHCLVKDTRAGTMFRFHMGLNLCGLKRGQPTHHSTRRLLYLRAARALFQHCWFLLHVHGRAKCHLTLKSKRRKKKKNNDTTFCGGQVKRQFFKAYSSD